MIQIIALFASQKEAEDALGALSNTHLGDSEMRIVSEWDAELEQREWKVLPVSYPTGALSGAVGPRSPARAASELAGPDDVLEFFEQSLLKEGRIVFVELSEEFQKRAVSAFEKQHAVAVARSIE
ncbi:MAG: hypothetical protein ACK2T1_10095 [Candidatus Promineifilaceae bacterium]|jgi:hypothetical protein